MRYIKYFEKYGLSDSVKIYSDFLSEYIHNKVDKWYNNPDRKNIYRTYNLQNIPKNVDFNIKNIKLILYLSKREKFGINASGFFYNYQENPSDYKNSSCIIDNDINLTISLTIYIPKSTISYDSGDIRSLISDYLNHELTHAYTQYKGHSGVKYKQDQALAGVLLEFIDHYWLCYLSNFLLAIYKLLKSEIESSIAELSPKSIDDLNKSIGNIRKIFNDTPESIYYKITTNPEEWSDDKKTTKYTRDLDHIGKYIIESYLSKLKIYNIEPDKDILKIRHMSGIESITYLYKIFKPKYIKYYKKASKTIFR